MDKTIHLLDFDSVGPACELATDFLICTIEPENVTCNECLLAWFGESEGFKSQLADQLIIAHEQERERDNGR